MPRPSGTEVNSNLSKGMITEASPLAFPKDACIATDNCVFQLNTVVRRRYGIDFEPDDAPHDITRDGGVVTSYVWKAVNGDGDVTIAITQYGKTLRFYLMDDTDALSVGKITAEIDLESYDVAGNPGVKSKPCQFTSGKGKLFVSHPYCDPFYVTYNASTEAITVTSIVIEIRDFEGVDDALQTYDTIGDHPAVLTALHEYNLINQGWDNDHLLDDGVTVGDVLDSYFTEMGEYPSNTDVWWTMRNIANEFDPEISVNLLFKGNSPAPKGANVLKAFDQNRQQYLELVLVPAIANITSSYFRPSTIAFFAGRIFYGGVDYPNFNTKIYFSQIIEKDDQIARCYQTQDPTAEEMSDLLPTDGGVISINEIGTIIKLHPIGNSLIVFASNGVWSIQGGEAFFKATDYSVNKLSSIGIESPSSFVSVEGFPMWWTVNAIYGLTSDKTTGTLSINNLTETTIQGFYDTITAQSIRYAQGAYNPKTKLVQWAYRVGNSGDIDVRHDYNRILNFNVQTGAFYPWTIGETAGTDSPYINGIICLENNLASTGNITNFYYLASRFTSGITYKFYFALEFDEDYEDWAGVPNDAPVNYISSFTTGYSIFGEANKDFQNNYIVVYMEDEETSSLKVVGVWDTNLSTVTFRRSDPQECYRIESNFSHHIAKLKIRGHGKILSLYFHSMAGKPFNFTGWSVFITSNRRP